MKTDDRKVKSVDSRVYAETMAETIRESVVVLDEDLRIISANRAFLETFRVTRDEIENRLLSEFGGGEWNIPSLLSPLKSVIGQKIELKNYQIGHDFPAAGQKFLVLNARQIPSHDGAGRWMLLAIEDRTEEIRTIEDLRKQTELLQLAHDAILVRGVDGVILFWNLGARETYGWSPAEACGSITHQLLGTQFPEPFEHWQEKLFSRGSWEGELVHLTKDGRRIHVASRQVLQHDQKGRTIGVLEINRDITSRKDAEEALRNLSGRLLQLQDEERRRIARELHDSTGQSLAALVIHLSAVSSRISAIDAGAEEMLREAIDLSQKASDETRTLSYLLYPPTLDHAGLRSALEWYIDGFTQRSKVKVELDVSIGQERLAEIVERTLFRVVQESLTNIFRHSGSNTASVRISRQEGIVRLEVADNGKGIPDDILTALNSSGGQLGVGIRGMRERIRQLGGWLQVRSHPGGTTIISSLPVD
jgi:PAS domain S-box-containing protein